MNSNKTVLSGTVNTKKGQKIEGAIVEVLNDKGERISHTYTTASGEYKILLSSSAKKLQKSMGKLTIQVSGKSGKIIAKKNKILLKDNTLITQILVSDSQFKKFSPVAPILQRHIGSIISPQQLDMIHVGLQAEYPDDIPLQQRIFQSIKCPAPDFAQIDHLIEDAWGVLEGNPVRTQRFLGMLDRLALRSTSRPANSFSDNSPTPISNRGRELPSVNTLFLASTSLLERVQLDMPCLISKDRFIPVIAAAVWGGAESSRSFSFFKWNK